MNQLAHDPANLTGVPDEGPMLPAGSQLHLTQGLCFLEKENLRGQLQH